METWAKALIVAMAALNGLVLLLNAGLKKYIEEKAKNLATKEDLRDLVKEVREKAVASKEGEITAIQNKLDTVVEQNKAIVLSSEEIRRQISSRQRIWELKREVAYDLLKITGTIGHLFASLCSITRSIFQTVLAPERAAMLGHEAALLQSKFKESLETLWQLEGTCQIAGYDLKVAYGIQKLALSGSALMAASACPHEDDQEEGRTVWVNARTEIIGLLQEGLKADA